MGGGYGDDPKTWSKSKRKRMRAKRKKHLAKTQSLANASGKQICGMGTEELNSSEESHEKRMLGLASDKKKDTTITSGGKISGKKRQRICWPHTSVNGELSGALVEAGTGSIAAQTDSDNAPKIGSAEMHLKLDEKEHVAGGSSRPKKKKKKKKRKTRDGTNQPLVNGVTSKKGKRNDEKFTTGTEKQADVLTLDKNGTKSNSFKNKIRIPERSKMSSLQKAFIERLTSSRFRELNEELYTHSSQHSFEHFTEHPELFDQYHVGFRKQVQEWPVNPVNVIFKKIVRDFSNERKKKGTGQCGEVGRKRLVVADFGCGDAKLGERLLALRLDDDGQNLTQMPATIKKKHRHLVCPFDVHSFDLVSGGNPLVTPADMSDVPLKDESVDIGVYCLALMGTNVADFVREAWRVLRVGGVLRVAEVRSRFETTSAKADDDDRKKLGGSGGSKRGKLSNGRSSKSDDGIGVHESSTPQQLMVLNEFISLMMRCGFENITMDRSNKMFLFMDFVKVDGSKGLSGKERFTVRPCLYKRR